MIQMQSATSTDTDDCPIWATTGFIPEIWCKEIIEHYGRELVQSRTTGNTGDMRISSQVYFENHQLAERIALAVRSYANDRNIDIGEQVVLETLSLVKYEPGGQYDWHMDNELTRPENRKVAVVIALNEGFVGGGTEFMWPHPAAPCFTPPKTGAIAIFPSVIIHRGKPVESGERWIIVTWALGPPWR